MNNENLAWKSSIFYCISPASIFLSAIYSESLFHLLTFLGLYSLYKHKHENGNLSVFSILQASVFFNLATLTRSTGMLYIIFIGYVLLQDLIFYCTQPKLTLCKRLEKSIRNIILGIISLMIIILAYVLVMYHPYKIYCSNEDNSIQEKPEWCNWKIPNAYTYIQLHFWEVKWFSSYRLSNIFNIYWGSHMLILFAIFIYKYVKENGLNTITIGIYNSIRSSKLSKKDAFYSEKNVPMILFSIFNFVINSCYAYIQCSTRILSAIPMIYWFAAYYTSENGIKHKVNEENKIGFRRHWIVYYFIYFLISGCVLFSNFYLFT